MSCRERLQCGGRRRRARRDERERSELADRALSWIRRAREPGEWQAGGRRGGRGSDARGPGGAGGRGEEGEARFGKEGNGRK